MKDDVKRLQSRLRVLIDQALKRHMYKSAIFYADVLITTSNAEEADDIALLARCYFYNSEFHRVINLALQYRDALQKSELLRLVTAKSMISAEKYKECHRFLMEYCNDPDALDDKSEFSSLCVLHGQLCEIDQDQKDAVSWYRKALDYDPFCYEALSRLVGSFLLSREEEMELVKSLKIEAHDSWIQCLVLGRESIEECGHLLGSTT